MLAMMMMWSTTISEARRHGRNHRHGLAGKRGTGHPLRGTHFNAHRHAQSEIHRTSGLHHAPPLDDRDYADEIKDAVEQSFYMLRNKMWGKKDADCDEALFYIHEYLLGWA